MQQQDKPKFWPCAQFFIPPDDLSFRSKSYVFISISEGCSKSAEKFHGVWLAARAEKDGEIEPGRITRQIHIGYVSVAEHITLNQLSVKPIDAHRHDLLGQRHGIMSASVPFHHRLLRDKRFAYAGLLGDLS